MDGRYVVAAVGLMAAALAWQALLDKHSAFAWSIPFAVILLFLAVTGESPAKRAIHWI